ncbi:MAG: SRPBCC family protein [Chloroflexota bacterium]
MSVTEHTLVINKPIDYVFRNVSCMRGCVNWITSIVSAEKLGDEPVHVGTQYKETYKFMGVTGESVITVQTYDPPYAFAFEDTAFPFPLEFHYTFDEVAGGTRVNAKMVLMPRETGKMDPAVVTASAAKLFDHDLSNLKAMLEADVEVRAMD